MPSLKEFLRKKTEELKKDRTETKKYNQKLKEEIKKARRKAFLTESIKQAGLAGQRRARAVHTKPKVSAFDSPISPAMQNLLWGISPKQQVVRKIKSKKKRKR